MASEKYIYAVGRRKRSTAVVKLYSQGTGIIQVQSENTEQPLHTYFGGNDYLYENAVYPFFVLENNLLKKVDATIIVRGGGIMGHSDAIKLAFSRALLDLSPDFRSILKPYGLFKRDPRRKERKKPGLKKARKSGSWSKR